MVQTRESAESALDLYVTCERLFRQAISVPATPDKRYQVTMNEMARAYGLHIEAGRKELMLRRFRECLSRGTPSIYEMSVRRMEQLNETDPVPHAATARYVADDDPDS